MSAVISATFCNSGLRGVAHRSVIGCVAQCCLRGDVGLPGTVRGHFKERDGPREDILHGFPEPQDRILAGEAKSLRLMSCGQHFARSIQHMQL